jgi:hypothetical protein
VVSLPDLPFIVLVADKTDQGTQCASLGAVTRGLLAALYYACQGDSGLQEYGKRTAGGKTKTQASAAGDPQEADFLKEYVRVYFPSRSTVLQSKGGKEVRHFRTAFLTGSCLLLSPFLTLRLHL